MQKSLHHRSIVVFAALFSLLSAGKAQIVFSGTPTINFSNGFLNAGKSITVNHTSGTGNASLDGSKLKLTDGGLGESRSAFYSTEVDISKFQATFDFQITDPVADGFTFCIQRDKPSAVGQGGGSLGYNGIGWSMAIKFDLFNDKPGGVSTTGLFLNGAPPIEMLHPGIDVKAASGIDFHSRHVMRVILTYVEGTLNEQITDLTTNAVFTHEYTVDLPAAMGCTAANPTAYVGFTAGTGDATSIQEIPDFTFYGLPPGVADVLKFRGDPGDTGQYLTETTLSATNVNSTNFGLAFDYPVDGLIYTQPLYKYALPITTGSYSGTTRDVVFVATSHDSLFAFDADNSAGSAPLWQTSFINPANGVTAVPSVDIEAYYPECGITGTPVIDPTTNTLYVCAKTLEVVSGTDHFVYRLHAINISDGSEIPGSPALMADTIATLAGTGTATTVSSFSYVSGPTVVGSGTGSVNGEVFFNALRQSQRAALTLVNGVVYVASASNDDIGPYHGWVLGYNATTLQNVAAWNDTPNGTEGGIWQSGAGLVSDSNGDLYFCTGNGTFTKPAYDGTTGSYINGAYGDSCVKLAVDSVYNTAANQNSNGWGLKVANYFTPFNQAYLDTVDGDLGSGGILLLPDSAGSAAHPHLLVFAGKEGRLYLVDRDQMGQFNSSADQVVQELANAFGTSTTGILASFDTAGYYNGVFYYMAAQGGKVGALEPGMSFTIAGGSFTASLHTPDSMAYSGASPIISGTGSKDPNAIVWCLSSALVPGGDSQLNAYDASHFNQEIYTSAQAADSRDAVGLTCHFALPTVANGRVYLGTKTNLLVYGLLNAQ